MNGASSMRERIRQRLTARRNGNSANMVSAALLDAALDYARRGWPVLPVHTPTHDRCSCKNPECGSIGKHPRTEHGVKDASTEEAKIRAWWQRWPDANVGVATGAVSGLVVLDVDGPEGEQSIRKLIMKHGEFPATNKQKTARGWHLVFRHPGSKIENKVKIAPGLDVRGDGGYFVVAPSLHASGKRYEWDLLHNPETTELIPLPDWLLTVLRPSQNGHGRWNGGRTPGGSDAKAEPTEEDRSATGATMPEGERNDGLFRFACWLRAQGREADTIFGILWRENLRRARPPLDEAEVRRIVDSACKYPAGTLSVHVTDLGNSERLIALHGEDLRYSTAWGKWLVYDGRRWKPDDTGVVKRLAKDTVLSMYSEAAGEPDDRRRQELMKHALRSESNAKIEAMVCLAESGEKIAVRPEQFDRDPWLLNVENGTFDLGTGKLREHRREDYLTKLAPVTFDPQARCPAWDAFLWRVMAGNKNLIAYLQRAVGYSLTGAIREHVLHLLYGGGANGKSTFLNTILGLLGDYGKSAAPGLLMRKYGETHPTEVADLRGTRFVASVEVEEGKRLAEVLTKQLTGGDRLKARRMREDFWEFEPTFKLFLAANHRPEIRGTDHAIWRRIRLVPFTVTIPEAEQDAGLGEKLRAEEWPGILNWALRGCVDWQRQGLTPPAEVTAANAGYRRDMDLLAHFLEERCVVGPQEESPFGELYGAYVEWAENTGERPLSRRAFGDRMTARGFAIVSRGGGKFRRGVRIRRSTEGRRGYAEHDDYDVF